MAKTWPCDPWTIMPLLAAGDGEGGAGGAAGDAGGGGNSGQPNGDSARPDAGAANRPPALRDTIRQAIEGGDDDGEAGDDGEATPARRRAAKSPKAGDNATGEEDQDGPVKRGPGGRFQSRSKDGTPPKGAAGADRGDEKDAGAADKPAGDEADATGDHPGAGEPGGDHPSGERDAADLAEPPASWNDDDKAAWDDLPETARALVHRREAEVASELNRIKQEAAPAATIARGVLEVLQPYALEMQQKGIKPLELVAAQLRDAHIVNHGTQAEKLALFRDLAQRMGFSVEGGTAFADQGAGEVAPALQQELNDLRQQVAAIKGAQDQVITASVKEQADRFAQAKDGGGKLLHPHFPKVRATMGRLLTAGLASSLDDAYAKACRMDDGIARTLAAEAEAKRVAAEKKAAAERKATADRARGSVTGKPGTARPNGADKSGAATTSLRDQIKAAARSAAGSTRV